jgi:hypothetical protein
VRLYDAQKDELLMLYWFLQLRADPVEFEQLFAEQLRNLTTILGWAKNSVSIMIDVDDDGIRFAAWCAPYLSGAEFGTWARKSARGTKAHLRFMNAAYDKALSQYPVLIGLTKQEKLHKLHLKMGYKLVGIVPSLFDGSPVREYYMTQETRDDRRNQQNVNGNGDQSLRAPDREVRQVVPASGATVRSTRKRGAKNGRRQRANSGDQSSSIGESGSGIDQQHADTGSPGESGTG